MKKKLISLVPVSYTHLFDKQLGTFMERMQPQDILMITADHGCDPGFKGTDHSRECVPFLACLLYTSRCV